MHLSSCSVLRTKSVIMSFVADVMILSYLSQWLHICNRTVEELLAF